MGKRSGKASNFWSSANLVISGCFGSRIFIGDVAKRKRNTLRRYRSKILGGSNPLILTFYVGMQIGKHTACNTVILMDVVGSNPSRRILENKMTKIEKAQLKALAIQTVSAMPYREVCRYAPRYLFWGKSSDEVELHNYQKKHAVEQVFEELVKIAK